MSSASKVRQSGRRHSAALEQEVVHQKVGHVTRHAPVSYWENTRLHDAGGAGVGCGAFWFVVRCLWRPVVVELTGNGQ
jgi:hypothetical protein